MMRRKVKKERGKIGGGQLVMVGVNTQRAEGKETIYRPCFIYITHTFHAWWMIPNHLSFLYCLFFSTLFYYYHYHHQHHAPDVTLMTCQLAAHYYHYLLYLYSSYLSIYIPQPTLCFLFLAPLLNFIGSVFFFLTKLVRKS